MVPEVGVIVTATVWVGAVTSPLFLKVMKMLPLSRGWLIEVMSMSTTASSPQTPVAPVLAPVGVVVGADTRMLPVPDAEFGARPVAFVAMQDGAAPDGPALATALRAHLPGLLVPVAFFPLPETEGLKPSRSALGEDAARRLGR